MVSKRILERFFSGKFSREEEQDLLNRPSVSLRMQQEWNRADDDMSGFDQQKVWTNIQSGIQTVIHRRVVMRWMWTAAAAASVLILMGIGSLWFSSVEEPSKDVAWLAFETAHKERIQLVLPDSTKVWLNAGSRIEYPENFGAVARQVKLSGEAYFDVTRQEKQPFYVTTEKLQVQVLGTKFTVSDYPKDSSAETVLVSGKVNVSIAGDILNRHYELSPNEQLLLDEQQQSTTIQIVDAMQYTEWINGRLSFDDAELGQIVRKLERWYGCKIECPHELGAHYRFTLTVRNESIEQIIQLIQSAVPIYFEQTGEHYNVVIK